MLGHRPRYAALCRQAWLLVLPCLLLVIACEPADPRVALLEERAKWTITPKSWVAGEDGTISMSIQVTGPRNSQLETLTFLTRLLDASGASIGEQWRSVDLSQVPLGAPTNMFIKLDAVDGEVDQLQLDVVANPTPAQEQHISELQL